MLDMTFAGFRLYRDATRRLTLELAGEVDEAAALALECEARVDLALVAGGSLRVLWDLSAVRGYTLEARVVLARVQQFLATKSRGTAFVAPQLTTRSLALWAARMGDGRPACIAADRAAAEAWLAASESQPLGVRQLGAAEGGGAFARRTG